MLALLGCSSGPNSSRSSNADESGSGESDSSETSDTETSDTDQDFAACTPPTGCFACGEMLCDSSSSYCQVQISDVGGEPNSYSCTPLPDACGNPVDCACLMSEFCGDMCEATGAGFTLTCPGG